MLVNRLIERRFMIITVSAASGLEAVTKRELQKKGIIDFDPPAINGRISFEGDMKKLAECNVLLSTAGRVFIKLAEFRCSDFDMLFDGVESIEWENYLSSDCALMFDIKLSDSKLHALTAVQSVAKKAIFKRLMRAYKTSVFSESGARYLIEISIRKDFAVISLNTSGDGLHKRGYRTLVGEAQIKETLAAALIDLSVWNDARPFADIFCGTGTIAIEAALKAKNVAPGLKRKFDFTFHKYYDEKSFEETLENAKKVIKDDKDCPPIFASDIDESQLKLAKKHARAAGVENLIKISNADMCDFYSDLKRGVVISNPPYGERLEDRKNIEKLYSLLGKTARKNPDWCFYTLTPVTDFERLFGRKADKKRKVYNGRIECFYYTHLAKKPNDKD